jgi:ribosomal protein S2
MSLPVIAIVDTNVKHHSFTFPINANEDSLKAVSYILNLVSKFILLLKYKKVNI